MAYIKFIFSFHYSSLKRINEFAYIYIGNHITKILLEKNKTSNIPIILFSLNKNVILDNNIYNREINTISN